LVIDFNANHSKLTSEEPQFSSHPCFQKSMLSVWFSVGWLSTL